MNKVVFFLSTNVADFVNRVEYFALVYNFPANVEIDVFCLEFPRKRAELCVCTVLFILEGFFVISMAGFEVVSHPNVSVSFPIFLLDGSLVNYPIFMKTFVVQRTF